MQKKFVTSYLKNSNMEQVAKELKISKVTCFKYLKDYEVKQAIETASDELLSNAIKELKNSLGIANKNLIAIIESSQSPPSTKIKAIELLYEICFREMEVKNHNEILELENKISFEQKEL
jgi:phage terminase small subunit